jgi:hypothetical protein
LERNSLPLPKDYMAIKKVSILKRDGSIEPLVPPASDVLKQMQKEYPALITNLPYKTFEGGAPTTLDELKAMCPPELTGLDRSEWIRTERQKYGI